MSTAQTLNLIGESNLPPPMPNPVSLTERAQEMVVQAMDSEGLEGHSLRVGVIGGGCSGLQYLLDFTKAPTDEDLVLELGSGFQVFVDPFSAAHLVGTQIDYVDSLQGSGFKFENPNIQRACGCGSSFST